jgi:hypothetical protein
MNQQENKMHIIQLANTIRNFAMIHYVPFMGFNEEPIIAMAQKYLFVTEHDVRVALEYICERGD